jgi:sialic acid synthase SpsE
MACSHEGDPDLAKKIIDGAADAGADAIQLQIWALEDMMAPSHPNYEVCQKIEMTHDQWKDIVAYSRKRYPKLDIYSFVYEHKSIDFTESLGLDGYKLSSSDLSNPCVLDCVAETGKKINLSIGASTVDEIQKAVDRIRNKGNEQITLMYGYQNFPTKIEDVHLNYMKKIMELFDLPVGYQDHCDADTKAAFWLPAMSVGMDIQVMEKHITHDRSFKGVDYESALNPDEFKLFVKMIRNLELAGGETVRETFTESEIKYRTFQKKSIVAAKDIKANDVLQVEDMNFLRTDELGLPPDQFEKIVGKVLKKDIPKFQLIREDDLT